MVETIDQLVNLVGGSWRNHVVGAHLHRFEESELGFFSSPPPQNKSKEIKYDAKKELTPP